MFITWLPGVGRLCLTVKYGRYSLKGADWYRDTGPGLRAMPYQMDQARMEAMRVSQVLQLRLNWRAPVSVALALPDMERDRRIERIANLSRVPLLWDLERCTTTQAGASVSGHFSQPPERLPDLEKMSDLLEDSAHGGVESSHAGGRSFRSTAGS